MPVMVPVFSRIVPDDQIKNSHTYKQALEYHEDPCSDVIIEAGVPCAIAFPRQSGDWLGFPYEDWEIPGSSLVATEHFWTYQNKVVSKNMQGYLLL